MRVLVVGSGGREHALCWAISGSPLVTKVLCAPGNSGISAIAECVKIDPEDINGLISFIKEYQINFVVIGPEAPLVSGLGDKLQSSGIKYFGPCAAAAQLEGSKAFMKDFCSRHSIPTASYKRFTNLKDAKSFLREKGAPIVVKADGLAAGKGVIVAKTVEEAEQAMTSMLEDNLFGKAGSEIILEELLEGEEVSFFVLCDGNTALPLQSAQDHKRVGEGDTGPNTGGMGAYSPAPIVTNKITHMVMEKIILPTIEGMKAEGTPYKGILYAGLMIVNGEPMLLEYNVRFGDPECQVLMMRLKSDILPALIAAHDGVLNDFDLRWYDEAALIVVMATNGYPGTYEDGSLIKGLEVASAIKGVQIFHSGTSVNDAGEFISKGGRVIGVAAMGNTIAAAREYAYKAVSAIDWPNGFYRGDIGWKRGDK